MKSIAALACKVTEGICQLPGVAILDWCDRAAAALTRLHPHAVTAVVVGHFDQRSVIQLCESTGSAWAGAGSPAERRMAGRTGAAALLARATDRADDLAPVNLESVRELFRDGQWLGWDFSPLSEGEVFVEATKLPVAPNRRLAPPLSQRYDAMQPSDVIVAAVGLSGDVAGTVGHRRVLACEVAVVGAQPADVQRIIAVLSAVLPMIGSRYLNAIGAAPATKQSWLTPREEVILWKLVAGKRVPVIADELHRSIYTVHDHVKSLHKKLGANNRGQLVSRALGHLGPLMQGENVIDTTTDD